MEKQQFKAKNILKYGDFKKYFEIWGFQKTF
jgi:hypothetical protein